MRPLISLDDPESTDFELVGGKAAHLAAARRRGFPVLEGVIVPTRLAAEARRAGARALAHGEPTRARIEARQVALDDDLADQLTEVAGLGLRLVVRSSTGLDDDGRWSGAFASFGDIAPEEVQTAVHGCWASTFAPDVLGRCVAAGIAPDDIELAVLVQPQVIPELSGWAEAVRGHVEVAVVRGSPAALFSGGRGAIRVEVDGSNEVNDHALPGDVRDAATAVAVLARRSAQELGLPRLEWASCGGRVVVFQLSPGAGTSDPRPKAEIKTVRGLGPYRRLAAILMQRRGPLATRFIASWAFAAPDDLRPSPVRGSPADLMGLAGRLAADLERSVTDILGIRTAALKDQLARGEPELARRLGAISIDRSAAALLLGALAGVGEALERSGQLQHRAEVWWQEPEWIEAALTGDAGPATRYRPDRFDAVVMAVVKGAARSIPGIGASSGQAVGRAVHLDSPDDAESLAPGDILIVDQPLPSFAPLLWRSAGLIAGDGDPAAHLCEVARSIHVPAVVGAGPISIPSSGVGRVAALADGDTGKVWLARF